MEFQYSNRFLKMNLFFIAFIFAAASADSIGQNRLGNNLHLRNYVLARDSVDLDHQYQLMEYLISSDYAKSTYGKASIGNVVKRMIRTANGSSQGPSKRLRMKNWRNHHRIFSICIMHSVESTLTFF